MGTQYSIWGHNTFFGDTSDGCPRKKYCVPIFGLLWLALVGVAQDDAPPCPLQVVSAEPLRSLTAAFEGSHGWTGADGAHSVALGDGRVLWLFGDTFLGDVEGGRRLRTVMIHNSGAIQDGGFRFFWGPRLADLFRPADPAEWYWPGDACVADGRLYAFQMRIRHHAGPPGFGFEEVANDLVCVDNPRADPTVWRVRRMALPQMGMRPGAACLVDGGWLYAYGLLPSPEGRPLGVARMDLRDGRWSAASHALFGDAAPEMSVSRVPGIPGFVAVYSPMGLSGDVLLRHAMRPEGPWSAPLRIYRCPEASSGLLLYGARAHPEQSAAPGELIVTYNRNVGALAEHFRRPEVYRPQAVRVHLRCRAGMSTRQV